MAKMLRAHSTMSALKIPSATAELPRAKQIAANGRVLLRQRAARRLRRNRIGFWLSLRLGDTNLRHGGVHKRQATGEL